MSSKKKKIFILIIIIIVVAGLGFGYNTYKKNYEICSYKWHKVENSSIGQYKLYITNKNGKPVDGRVLITYLNGKSKYEDINKDVKSVIKKVSNPKRR